MGLTMNEKQAVTKQLALDYKRATKKNKGRILDVLVRLADYNWSYAARVRSFFLPEIRCHFSQGGPSARVLEKPLGLGGMPQGPSRSFTP